jgi:hypothetical protein
VLTTLTATSTLAAPTSVGTDELCSRVPARFFWPIPHLTEPDWDPVCAPRPAGFPVNICYACLRGELGPEYDLT